MCAICVCSFFCKVKHFVNKINYRIEEKKKKLVENFLCFGLCVFVCVWALYFYVRFNFFGNRGKEAQNHFSSIPSFDQSKYYTYLTGFFSIFWSNKINCCLKQNLLNICRLGSSINIHKNVIFFSRFWKRIPCSTVESKYSTKSSGT